MSNKPSSKSEFKPLYLEVQQTLTDKIIAGDWKPGEMLPSEFQLADLLGVSQGTVRKALNGLGESNIVFRRQGVGTFVCENTLKDVLFHFFHYKSNDGKDRGLPTAKLIKIELIQATDEIAHALTLKPESQVIKITRIRKLAQQACIAEQIYLPHRYFSDLHTLADLPNSLYHYYQEKYQVTINKASDNIQAVIATAEDHALIGVAAGQPLLQVSRVATALDGTIVEYRISRVDSAQLHYLVELN